MLLWKIRCVAAWVCRGLGILAAVGLAETSIVGFGAFGVFGLLGRLISRTNPKGPMPRLRDDGK
jgi:hypothetical protein